MRDGENDTGKSEDISFEEAYRQLEETVRTLEEGGLSLVEATDLFEKGMSLSRICQDILSSAELKINRLQTSFGEQMRLSKEDRDDVAEG
jgi:exodeoxyribonuclease VII small subunit